MKSFFILFTVCGLATKSFSQVPNYVSTNGLIGWWPFSGNANDLSGNLNNGLINGASLTNDRFGNTNSAYNFDGINDWIEINDNVTIRPANEITISLWAYVEPLQSNGSFTRILSKQYNEPQNFGSYQIITGSNPQFGKTGITVRTGPGNSQTTPGVYNWSGNGSNNLLSEWQHIVGTYDGSILKFYQNGQLISSIVHSGNLFYDNGNLLFGKGITGGSIPGSNMYFNGKIDDVGIWNRSLDQCEILNLYNSQVNWLQVSAGIDQSICDGTSVTLSGSGANTYSWNNGVSNGVGFNPTVSNEYVVIGTDANGCLGTDTVNVVVNNPSTSTLTETALDSYTLNGQTYTQSGTYTQVIPNAAGCDSTITLDLTLQYTGIEELKNDILVYPNPSASYLTIESNWIQNEEFMILDMQGREIKKGTLSTSKEKIDLKNVAIGYYILRIGAKEIKISKE